MSDELTVTILDLLNLSLGTPEIGAVNFNLLHRFLLELVKHLQITRKQIDITDDISIQSALEETRMLSGSQFLAYSNVCESADGKRLSEVRARASSTALDGGGKASMGSGIRSRDSLNALQKFDTNVMRGKESPSEMAKFYEGETSGKEQKRKDSSPVKRSTSKEAESRNESVLEGSKADDRRDTREDQNQRGSVGMQDQKQGSPATKEDSTPGSLDRNGVQKESSPVENQDKKESNADGKEDAKQGSPDLVAQLKAESPQSQRSFDGKSGTSSPQLVMNNIAGKSVFSVRRESRRVSPASSKTDIRKRSLMEVTVPGLVQLERKISILEAKIESLSSGPTNLELVQQARDLQSRDSSTNAAGDMWQAMNLVRRIEVAEGAIDGITAMLDDINEQLRKMKEKAPDGRLDKLSDKLENISKLHNPNVDKLQAKLAEIDGKLKNVAYKVDLKPYLTVKKMNETMDFKLQNYRQLSPTVPKSPKKVASSKLTQSAAMEIGIKPKTTGTDSAKPSQQEITKDSTDVKQAQTTKSSGQGQVETPTRKSSTQDQVVMPTREANKLESPTRKISEQAVSQTTATNKEQPTNDSTTANNFQSEPEATATTPSTELADSEQADFDDARYADVESVEATSPIARPIEDERRGSITTQAFEELCTTMSDWCDFRDLAAQKLNDLEESVSHTVDKNALMNLKNELKNLADVQAALKNSQQQVEDELNKLVEMQPFSKHQPRELQPVASQSNLSQLESSVEERLHALSKNLQEMKQNFFQLYEMKESIGNLKESEDIIKSDIESIRRESLKIMKQLEEQETRKATVGQKRSSRSFSDSDEFHHVRSSLLEMKSEIEKHNAVMAQFADDQNKKQLLLETLYGHVDHLENAKADRNQMNRDIEVKADRKDLETKVSQDKFQNSLSSLDQSVQDLVEKLVGHEATLKQAINHITSDVNAKLDKMDMDTVKNYFEGKLKDLNSKVQRKPSADKSQAAVSRCMLLQPANCISCDRPVHLYREGPKLPSLPFNKPLPHTKSNRPYMSFDLNDVRQEMYGDVQTARGGKDESLGQAKVQNELLKLGAIKEGEELPEVPHRPCGGNHTLTSPEKRTTIRVNKAYREDLHFIGQLSQKDLSIIDILGYDGHVYKGHVSQLPAIPDIPKNTIAQRPPTGSGQPRTSSPI